MSKLSVVFCWHMHQPFYREAESGCYHLPWVYLHAIKDYTDMATILDQVPGSRAVVNFVPSLTAQIEDYAIRLRGWLDHGGPLPDPLLTALANPDGVFDGATRNLLLHACFRLNHERNLHRYPHFSRLWSLAEHAKNSEASDYLGPNFFTDLVTWYHLGWLGETVRRSNFIARRLIEKGRGFNAQDRRDLLNLIATLLIEIPDHYRRLVKAGRIELSTTPYAHPILPLLLDFQAARQTVPDAMLPAGGYPGGKERADDHIQAAITAHEEFFGVPAHGVWPAEGAVSSEACALLGAAGFKWCATGEGVPHHSLGYNLREHYGAHDLYQPWLLGEGTQQISCFFRDDKLSDMIGFEYQKWQTRDAINNFIHELSGIHHRTLGMEAPVVSIIMDGENAWEYYQENGLPFLTGLYQAIVEHPSFELTTFADYLVKHPAKRRLEKLVPGSWVYGNLATWIGDAAKTRGWELLIQAKQAFDRVEKSGKLSAERLEAAKQQLRICEGSDWCWWFGDYNPSDTVRDFDALYRQHLKKLYELLDQPAPPSLGLTISQGSGSQTEQGGVMRR